MDLLTNEPSRLKRLLSAASLTVIISIIAVATPYWGPWAELRSHSLAARLTSSVALKSPAISLVPDVQVSIGGQSVVDPFLSTIVLTNDGSRAIVASDFESPLEFAVNSDVEVVRATISAIEPLDLKGEIVTEKRSVKLKPILLNPGDSLQFAIITTGKPPNFSVRARIAGVSKIILTDESKKKIPWRTGVAHTIFWLLSLIMFPIFMVALSVPAAIRSQKSIALGGLVVAMWHASSSSYRIFDWIGIEHTPFLFTGFEMLFATPIIFYLLLRARPTRAV